MKRRDFLKSAALTAAVSAEWPRFSWSQDTQGKPDPNQVKRVLVVFKCHLDVGFTDTQANVMRAYFDRFFPQAITIGAKLREQNGTKRYVWTTGSWLLYEYLEQANSDERRRMEKAVEAGEIAWHALPFSWQTEVLDRSMIEGCLGFSSSLDARFGRKTIAGKMTDVPGHSRGLLPALAAHNIQLLDIGVNPASTPPEVPEVFRWKDPSGTSIVTLYHRHGYGGVIQVPGSDLAIDIAMRSDNGGPHSEQEINDIYAKLQKQFPNAQISPANLSELATAIKPAIPSLPVFTEEIGDTWIYGVPSDPPKIARFREMARLRKEWLRDKKFACGDAVDRQLLRRLALAPEHTWGTDTKRYIDHDNYSPKQLAACVDKPNYQIMERSWQEKRDNIDTGISNLPAALQAEARKRLDTLRVTAPQTAGMTLVPSDKPIDTAHFHVQFDPATGAITKLVRKHSGHSWASSSHPLALFTYQTLTQPDYTAFLNAYIRIKSSWAPQDFGKPNIDRFPAQSRSWHPTLEKLWFSASADSDRIVAELRIHDPESEQAGLVAWPGKMYLEMQFPKAEPVVHLTFFSLRKAINRMPESMWITFHPEVTEAARWALEKVNQQVDPMHVVQGGSRSMHAVTSEIACNDQGRRFQLNTLDAPTIALGTRSPLNYSDKLPDLSQGVHVNLFNNAWGTNYPQWAGGDWMYRFTLTV